MTEDDTKDLTPDETLRLILAEVRELKTKVSGLDARVAALEAQAAERSNTTRPLLDRLIQGMIETREMLLARQDRADEKQDQMAEILCQIKGQIEVLAIRESKYNAPAARPHDCRDDPDARDVDGTDRSDRDAPGKNRERNPAVRAQDGHRQLGATGTTARAQGS
jgi:hypothetical protein